MEDTPLYVYYAILLFIFAALVVSFFVLPIYGENVAWNFNMLGFTLASAILSIFMFVFIWYGNYAMHVFYVAFNEWVYDVENMSFWFNRSFWVWLFAKNRKRWIKLNIISIIFLGPFMANFLFGAFTWWYVTVSFLAVGYAFSQALTFVFAFIFYKAQLIKLETEDSEVSEESST